MSKIRLSTFAIFCVVILSGGLLLHVSQEVQDAQNELHVLERKIEREKEAAHVLEVEWEYLNNPQRLDELAQRYLGLNVPEPSHMGAQLSSFPEAVHPSSGGTLLHNIMQNPVQGERSVQQEMSVIPARKPSVRPISVRKSSVRRPKIPQKDFDALIQSFSDEDGL